MVENETQTSSPASRSLRPQRVFVVGATGTIGRATVRALVRDGHEVVCFVRPRAGVGGALMPDESAHLLKGATVRFGEVADAASLARDGFRGEHFDALVSCLASRTGTPKDAWAIDHRAHVLTLTAAREAGVSHMVLLSAICVQKPRLAFQQAKLAFETLLVESGLTYSIVRPTAFFKSLSGQIGRVRQGKPFLLFGDGLLRMFAKTSESGGFYEVADGASPTRIHGDLTEPSRFPSRLESIYHRSDSFEGG